MAVIWTVWILAFVTSFAFLEGYALMHHTLTLSRYVWDASENWPPLIFLLGLVVGGLAVHFWWHWAPPGSLGGTAG